MCNLLLCVFFFFNDTATTEIYTLSLHDALPISCAIARTAAIIRPLPRLHCGFCSPGKSMTDLQRAIDHYHDLCMTGSLAQQRDRKSTRLNSSHANISYAVFCLKKKTSN